MGSRARHGQPTPPGVFEVPGAVLTSTTSRSCEKATPGAGWAARGRRRRARAPARSPHRPPGRAALTAGGPLGSSPGLRWFAPQCLRRLHPGRLLLRGELAEAGLRSGAERRCAGERLHLVRGRSRRQHPPGPRTTDSSGARVTPSPEWSAAATNGWRPSRWPGAGPAARRGRSTSSVPRVGYTRLRDRRITATATDAPLGEGRDAERPRPGHGDRPVDGELGDDGPGPSKRGDRRAREACHVISGKPARTSRTSRSPGSTGSRWGSGWPPGGCRTTSSPLPSRPGGTCRRACSP